MGDFNAHHDVWGSEKYDSRGRIILKIAEDHNLIVMNEGHHTRFDARSGKTSAIDLTIVSHEIANKLGWSVDDDLRGSDHFPIFLTNLQTPPNVTLRRRWKYEEANWPLFEQRIDQNLPASTVYSIEEISQGILTAAKEAIPRTSGKPGKKAAVWWNDEVKKAIRLRRKLLRKLRKMALTDERRPNVLEEFKKARSAARKVIAKAKKLNWG